MASPASTQSAQKESHDSDRKISERGSKVRLLQHHRHRNTDNPSRLDKVRPGKLALASRSAKYLATAKIKMSLTHSEGWK